MGKSKDRYSRKNLNYSLFFSLYRFLFFWPLYKRATNPVIINLDNIQNTVDDQESKSSSSSSIMETKF